MNMTWLAASGVALAAGLGLWLAIGSDDSPAPLVPAAATAGPESIAPSEAVAAANASPARRVAAAPELGEGAERSQDEDEVDLGGIKKSTMEAVRGLDRPARRLGEAATAPAMEAADMSALAVNDPDYDEVVDAHQLFNPFERDILSRGQITPAVWAGLIETHAPAKERMLERSVELARAGKADKSESMLLEWNGLEAGYEEQVE